MVATWLTTTGYQNGSRYPLKKWLPKRAVEAYESFPISMDRETDMPKLGQNRIFSGKMTIFSYKTTFEPTFSAILENLLEPFFRKVPKTAILGQNGHFFAR